jgi:large subunit ribosomal protein L13
MYPGQLKEKTAAMVRDKHPERILEAAIWGMLPKNRLGRKLYKKVKIYAGNSHPHAAQNPEQLKFA